MAILKDDDISIIYKGPCIPIGFSKISFVKAVYNRPKDGDGYVFTAFVIPETCRTIEYLS